MIYPKKVCGHCGKTCYSEFCSQICETTYLSEMVRGQKVKRSSSIPTWEEVKDKGIHNTDKFAGRDVQRINSAREELEKKRLARVEMIK